MAVLATALLAACRSDEAPVEEVVADREEAEAVTAGAVIRPTDLPPGLVALADGQKLDQEPLWGGLLRCMDLGPSSDGQVASTASATYGQGAAARATSTVTFLTDSRAEQVAAALTGDRADEASTCAMQGFGLEIQRHAPPGGQPGPVRVVPLSFPNLAKPYFARRGAASVDAGGAQVSVFLDLVVILDGNVVTRMLFVNTGGLFPTELQGSFVERVAART